MRLQKRSIVTALLASTALASPAFAQTATQADPEATTVEEVVVTGIRGSQEQAINIKHSCAECRRPSAPSAGDAQNST